MTERHGIFVTEVPTKVLADQGQNFTLPVVFGTAPVHLTAAAAVNVPIFCSSFDEAKAAFGYSDDWGSYTLCEFMQAYFQKYRQRNVVFVNVLNPAIHKTPVAPESVTVTSGVALVEVTGIIKTTVVVTSADGATTYNPSVDYSAGYNAAGYLVVTRRSTGSIPSNVTQLRVGYDKVNPSAVTSMDIIGGADGGNLTGLELLNQVFPRFGVVPDLVLVPGFAQDPVVAAVAAAKAESINGGFKAEVVVDLNVDQIDQHAAAPAWKRGNSFTSRQQVVCYGKAISGSKTYWLSSHVASRMCAVDAANNGIPYVSPSNKPLLIDGMVAKDGAELYLGQNEASHLNSEGIVTAINFSGWRAWGNRTGAFPDEKDVVNAFIPVRRMMNWLNNQIILRTWSRVDTPITKRLIESITDDINIWLNGLQGSGALVGGRVEFRADENSETDLLDGKVTFHVFVAPPTPAQAIDFLVEYDTNYLGGLLPA
ncbi:phage tail sheath family protein [Paenibacillus xanthanilyticus]|uniref:Phage tail sheath family protein n=1 Tax=Paenibacillus xanthanilyticus TaxID=1783531 RepID=A0ABV8KA44_9BACL